ncbi:DKNYY domain-containing protein [Chryseobacterium sp. Bi04]|uniref:DKNYY domain-containing protein n=1 Tax=Chryseobacterium sp. Bi04 TaxID=2822345 RepID=UPI001DFDF4BE|nr:DKNYY domain-containing protein [Chryseobacterium sp. Bi04]CAH0289956.1 hypothetical protein SRABI04_04310 [Chryseobacterium sp. Bi04]
MTIPQEYTPDNIMTGLYSIYARRLFIEKIVKAEDYIYINGLPIMDKNKNPLIIDIDTFSCISYGFFKDKNAVYGLTYISRKNSEKCYLTVLKDADPDSFEPISMLYAKDKNRYYYAEDARVIAEKDLMLLLSYTTKYQDEEFPDLKATYTWSSYIAIGQNFVYNRGLKLKGADSGTFVQMSQYYYKDKDNFYVKDGRTVKPLKNIDIKSFIILADDNYVMATDKNKPMMCYANDSKPEEWYDYYRPYFEKLRDEISDDYWWYKLEKTLKNR